MTKKHFIAMANVIRAHNRVSVGDREIDKFNSEHLNALAHFLCSQNPNFNRERWLDYIDGKCGPNGGARP